MKKLWCVIEAQDSTIRLLPKLLGEGVPLPCVTYSSCWDSPKPRFSVLIPSKPGVLQRPSTWVALLSSLLQTSSRECPLESRLHIVAQQPQEKNGWEV